MQMMYIFENMLLNLLNLIGETYFKLFWDEFLMKTKMYILLVV